VHMREHLPANARGGRGDGGRWRGAARDRDMQGIHGVSRGMREGCLCEPGGTERQVRNARDQGKKKR